MVFEVNLKVPAGNGASLLNSISDNTYLFRSTWLPDMIGKNYALNHGDQFTVTGLKAIHLRDNYSDQADTTDKIAMAVLKVISA